MVDSNICYCEHENVNQDCLYCRLLMEKNESSLQSDNNFLDKKMIGNVTKTLTIECYNNNFCCDIKKETKKYLERIFKNDNDSRSIIINKNNTFDENKNNYLIFQSFLKLLHFIIKEKIFNDVLETFNIISFYIKLLDKINLNVYLWRILFDGKNKIQKKEIILSNDIRLKYGLVDECFIKSIDLNGESFEEFIIINNLFSIQETICYHTKVKKFIIGGCQKTSYDDKNILIFGTKNSNISFLINEIFNFLYHWMTNEDKNYFLDQVYTLNKNKELCIYEFNNTILPYKIRLIDCPEYNINHNYRKQFNIKKLYKDFFRKYVISKGYLVLSSVIIAVEKENYLLNNNFQNQIKILKNIFGECNDNYIFEKCINGILKYNEEINNFSMYNNISKYLKKLENNYNILLKLP